MLAKICSDWNKPNGQAYMAFHRQEIIDFIGGLEIRKIPYIGAMTETTLKEIGIRTGQDL
jgi:DNA polymerase kappa